MDMSANIPGGMDRTGLRRHSKGFQRLHGTP
jgi:hypothetical protein